jgi:hypothetical protein
MLMFFICYDVTNNVTIKEIHVCVVLRPYWPTLPRWEYGYIGLLFGFALLPVHGICRPVHGGLYSSGSRSCVSNKIVEE